LLNANTLPTERECCSFPPSKQNGLSSVDLERKLDRLDAQLKALESKLSTMKAPQSRHAELPTAPGGYRSRLATGNIPGPGGFGPGFGRGFGDVGQGAGTTGGTTAGGTVRREAAPNAEFENRLDKIIGELEQLKKDMKGGHRGGR